MVQVTEEYHPPDADYWEEIMPQFDLDDAVAEGDLLVEEVTCNMIEPELIDDRDQDHEKFCIQLHSQDSDGVHSPERKMYKIMMISNKFMMVHV